MLNAGASLICESIMRWLVAGVAVLPFLATAATASEACAPGPRSTHGVAHVIDGETLLLDNGQEVRLIGALAPGADSLSSDTNDGPPARDALEALGALVAGRAVALPNEGRRYDRYGRLLVQAYIGTDAGAVWIQERLIRDGHARAYALPGNAACLAALINAESEARIARRGLWRREDYGVRSANDIGGLLGLTGRFALVEGRVAQVSQAQRTTYINFGIDWRRDFTASIASAIVVRSDDGARRLQALAGKAIRVRGWIERRNGPMIVLGSLDEIEVLGEAGEMPPK